MAKMSSSRAGRMRLDRKYVRQLQKLGKEVALAKKERIRQAKQRRLSQEMIRLASYTEW